MSDDMMLNVSLLLAKDFNAHSCCVRFFKKIMKLVLNLMYSFIQLVIIL